ncbi:metallophosphoesterase family protein [Corynebacterium sp. 335C]
MKFLHTSDWHLGKRNPRYARTDADTPGLLAAGRLDAVARIGELAEAEGCAFIVVAGDVFDSNNPDERNLQRSVDALAALPVPVYLLPGNHDSLDRGSVYRREEFGDLPGVHVIDSAEPITVADGVELVGAPLLTRFPVEDPATAALAALDPAPDGVVRVFCGHGQFEGFGADDEDDATRRTSAQRPDLAAVEAALDDGRIHYAAFGDRHLTQRVADRIRYSGSPEPTEFRGDPADTGNVLVVEVDEADPAGAVDVVTHHVGAWTFLDLPGHVSSGESLRAWFDAVEAVPDKSRTMLRYHLTGTVTFAQHLELERRLENYRSRFPYVAEWSRHHDLTLLPDDLEDLDWGPGGFIADAAAELAGLVRAGGADADADAARRALAHLYHLTAKGR